MFHFKSNVELMVGFTTLVNQNTIDYTSTKVKSNHTNRLVLPGLPTSF